MPTKTAPRHIPLTGQDAMRHPAWERVSNCLDKLEPFDLGGTCKGRKMQYVRPYPEGLTGEYLDQWREDEDSTTFVIVSYHIVIGWYNEDADRWTVPDLYHTKTTGNHQSILRMALRERGYES